MTTEPFGVLGGTFDPVHVGHVELARSALARLPLARVVLLPCAVPPHKDPPDLSAAAHRRAMLDLAVTDHPGLAVCTSELEKGGVSYTIDTLRTLRQEHPGAGPIFVMGMDSLQDLPTWHRFEPLLDEFHLVVFDRPDRTLADVRDSLHPAIASRLFEIGDAAVDVDALGRPDGTRPARIFHVRQRVIDVSSREVRQRVRRGAGIDDLVPPGVGRYIQSNGIYRREDRP